jgi:hypothetical protein
MGRTQLQKKALAKFEMLPFMKKGGRHFKVVWHEDGYVWVKFGEIQSNDRIVTSRYGEKYKVVRDLTETENKLIERFHRADREAFSLRKK